MITVLRPGFTLLIGFKSPSVYTMGRGNSCGGGQSSLDYLFGGDAPAPKQAPAPRPSPTEPNNATTAPAVAPVTATAHTTATTTVEPTELNRQIPAGIKTPVNNYARAEGQNTGNFITVCFCFRVHYYSSTQGSNVLSIKSILCSAGASFDQSSCSSWRWIISGLSLHWWQVKNKMHLCALQMRIHCLSFVLSL